MRNPLPSIEPLESRIAPALTLFHPLPDITAGLGKIGVTLDLGAGFVADGTFRTHVRFNTNYVDPANPSVPQFIDLELFDDKAPLTVDNFLHYVLGLGPSDYDGTFFHRLVGGFVLQGGGFDISNSAAHIGTLPSVHNEFHPGDAETSNLVGTVAMAKVGGNPNSATSEFFFNLGDNSANLDSQNGGFTVFGKIVTGMNVVNAIAALPISASGAPAQNGYNADPDNNPLTPPPAAAVNQLIQISHAQIIPPADYSANGVSYSLDAIVDAVTSQPIDLFAAKLAGDNLKLDFKPGASGVAKVTVRASQAGEADVTDSFLVTVKPNLLADVTGDTLPSVIVPGDTGLVNVRITNSAASILKGKVDIDVFYGNNTSPLVKIGALAAQSLSLAAAKTKIIGVKVAIPAELAATSGQQYQIVAQVTPSAGQPLTELFSDDNSAPGPIHSLFNAFGTFTSGTTVRKDVPLTFHDAAGKLVKLTLKGGGFGQLFPSATAPGSIIVNGSTAKSALILASEKGAAPYPLKDVTIQRPSANVISPLALLDLHSTRILGDIFVKDGVKKLLLGDVGDGTATHSIQVDVFGGAGDMVTTITAGVLRDVSLTSNMPIGNFTAKAWLDTGGTHEAFIAPSLVNLNITGGLAIAGDFAPSLTLKDAVVKLASFKVAGSLTGSTVLVAGDVGSVKLGAMVGSNFAAGITVLPTSLGDFVGGRRTIASFSIATFNSALANSNIIAAQIGKLTLANVADGSATVAFGIYADRIGSYQRSTFKLAALDTAGTFDTNGFYKVTLL